MYENDAPVPDFSELPDVVWVRVLKELSLADRANVALTCHALNDVFNHPSLWHTQNMRFIGDTDNFTRKSKSVIFLPDYVSLTKRFGKYFQNLKLIIDGHFRSLPEDLKNVLEEITDKCRLETLTIDAGTIASMFNERYGFPPDRSAVKALAAFVQNAFRMKRLNIRTWPMYNKMDTDDCNIFKVLVRNEKLRDVLESLTIFWLEEKEWSEREPIFFQGHINATVELVDSFKNLTTLGLRTPMLSEELLEKLAQPERAKLQLLKIVVHFIDPERKPEFRIPSVHSSVWQALVNRNHKFRVECTVFLNTPNFELSNLLTPEVPLSVFSYMKYSKVDPQTLIKLATQYTNTLSKFHSFCDSYNVDQELILLSQKCLHLTEFIYHGEIRANTVVAIARARNEALTRFEVREDKVKVPTEFDDVDEDDVLIRGADGQLVQVDFMRFHMPEEQKEQALHSMATDVSAALRNPWKPLK